MPKLSVGKVSLSTITSGSLLFLGAAERNPVIGFRAFPRMALERSLMDGITELTTALDSLVHHKPVMVKHGGPAHDSEDKTERRLNGVFELSRCCDVTYP